MSSIEKAATRVNLWTALLERFGKLANAFGWEVTPTKLVNTVWPVTVLVGGMIWQYVPWYVIIPVSIFAFGSLLHLYAGIARAVAVQGVKSVSMADAAAMCERAARGFYDFVEARTDEVADISNYRHPPDGADVADYWDMQRAKEEALMRRVRERIGGDVGAAVAMLKMLGIDAESDLRSIAWADKLARFFSAQAQLLRAGHLEAAQNLDRHRMFF